MIRLFRYLLRKFYFACALLLITLAVIVQGGRMLAPWAGDYRADVANHIGKRLNAQVSLQELQLQWNGLKPVLSLAGLAVTSRAGEPILAVGEARLRLDLLRSLRNWQLVWGTVDLEATRLAFQQTREGFWHLSGFSGASRSTDSSAARSGSLPDMLLLVGRMEFRNTHLAFHFYNGQQITLDSPSLMLENEDDFHRLELSVDIEGRERAVYLVLESEGDPRDQSRFSMKGYLELEDFPTSEPLMAAGGLLLGDVTLGRVTSEGGLTAQLWFNSRPAHEGYDLRGQLDLQTLSVPLFDKIYRLDHFSTSVDGYWLRGGQWRMLLADISARLQDTRIDGVNLALSVAKAEAPMVVRMDQLQLESWLAGVRESGLLQDSPVLGVLTQLNPRGTLDRIRLQLPLRDPAGWQLEAMASAVGVDAWNGVPALTGVNGYVQAHQRGGFINLDSPAAFSMHYIPTYQDAMHYQQARGQIAWWLQPESKRIYVNSGAIRLRNEQEEATGYLWLSIPWRDPGADLDLYLHIGARQLQAGLYQKYVPAIVPGTLRNWLQESIGDGNPGVASEAGFIFRGTLNTPQHHARSYQLYLDLDEAALDYHPDWPAVASLRGRLLLDDENIDASVFSGRLRNSQLDNVRLAIRPNPDDEGGLLTLSGEVRGLASDGLEVLREGYLRQLLGNAMDSWYFQGTQHTRLDIAVPLAAGAAGARQRVDVDFEMPMVGMENLSLYLREVNGRISYSSDTGLHSDRLTGILFDQPVSAGLATRENDGERATALQLEGQVDANDLAGWTRRPEVLFLKGLIPYQADIAIHHPGAGAAPDASRVSARVTSDLAGAEVDLPSPFAKPSEETRRLQVELDFKASRTGVFVDYRDADELLLQGRFDVAAGDDERLLNADVAIAGEAQLQPMPQFRLSGFIESLDINQWLQVRDRYEVYQGQIANHPLFADNPLPVAASESAPGVVAGLPLHIDVLLGRQALGPLTLENLALSAWRRPNAWQLNFMNPILKGRVSLPDARSIPMDIAIDELHLTRELLGDTTAEADAADTGITMAASLNEAAARFDPRSLPRSDVSIQALYLEGHNYGSWSLQVRPDPQGVMFRQIRGQLRGINLAGVSSEAGNTSIEASPDLGAWLYWSSGDEGDHTRFVGVLTTSDMADVMRQWQKPDILESSRAAFQVDLGWPGAPGLFALANLQGDVDLQLSEGRFNRSTGAGEGVLRLLSLLNFDTLARRLRLDFSDLYKSGLTFDQVRGRLHFDRGHIQLSEPLLVESPSSRMQLAGSINLRNETINARLVAALPVAGNLTFLAAVATGLPAAAGIYLVSKLFRKQVDQATSVSYTIRGGWDNPVMKFDRLFESEESLRQNATRDAQEDTPPNSGED